MSLRRACILVCVVAVAASAQQHDGTRAAPGFRVSGTVVNAVGGQPLSGIELLLTPVEGRLPLHVVTGSDGHFLFSGLTRGKYALNARGPGFPGQGYEEHEYFSTAIAVGPGLESENLVFRLKPGARISGTITDEADEPVRGAQVWLFKSALLDGVQAVRMRGQTNADERGHYAFRYLSEGSYFVVVMATPWYAQHPTWSFHEGGPPQEAKQRPTSQERELEVAYPVTYYPGVTESGEATPIAVRPGDRFTADFQLRAVPSYYLRVRYAAGERQHLSVVMQRIFDVTIPTMGGTGMSNNVSAVAGLAPGHYILTFTAEQSPNNSRETELDVVSDMEIDASNLDAAATASISGTVQAAGGARLPREAFLMFANRQNQDEFRAQVSPTGEFSLQHGLIGPGNYEVTIANADNLTVYSISATGAKVSGHSVHLPASAPVHLNVVLSNGEGKIDGIVLRDKKPVSTALVLLVPQDLEHSLSLVRRDQSDSDGTFTLARVVPGNYTVVAIQDGWNLKWADPNVLKPYLAGGTPITITTTRHYHVTLQAQ